MIQIFLKKNIFFTQVYNASDEDEARENFAKIVCEKLKESSFVTSIDLLETCAYPQLILNSIN